MAKLKNVFIDSNVWLSLYCYSKNDLSNFGKLKKHINTSIKLYVPQQVIDEIKRNRGNKLVEVRKKFLFSKVEYPAFCKGYKEYKTVKKSIDDVEKEYIKWKKTIDADIKNENLPADKTIKDIIKKASIIDCDSYVRKAEIRYNLGNPPGKRNSLGDAVIWESLLDKVTAGEDLYFISDDKDYKSSLDDRTFNEFLSEEWRKKKESKIIYYTNVVDFVKDNIKEIVLKDEQSNADDTTNFTIKISKDDFAEEVSSLLSKADRTDYGEYVDIFKSINQSLGDKNVYLRNLMAITALSKALQYNKERVSALKAKGNSKKNRKTNKK